MIRPFQALGPTLCALSCRAERQGFKGGRSASTPRANGSTQALPNHYVPEPEECIFLTCPSQSVLRN